MPRSRVWVAWGAAAGELLASASTDKDIQVWGADRQGTPGWRHREALSGHTGSVVALACKH